MLGRWVDRPLRLSVFILFFLFGNGKGFFLGKKKDQIFHFDRILSVFRVK